jgi:hypothetical protein
MGLIDVDRMRQKDAGAEQPEKYHNCVNHDVLTFAQCPALTLTPSLRDRLFQDDFVLPRKWFRGPVPPTRHHRLFILRYRPWGCKSERSPDVGFSGNLK